MPPVPHHAGRRLLLALLAAAATFACRPADPPPMRLADRWIADGSTAASGTSALYRREQVLRWDFTKPSDLVGWNTVGLDLEYQLLPGKGLRMRSSGSDPCLWRAVDFDADEVDEIEIVRSPLTGGRLQVFWQRDEVTFTEESSVSATQADRDGGLTQTFTFRLGGNPRWKGRIRYLRFDLTERATHRVVLGSISASRYQLAPAELPGTVAAARRIQLERREMLARLSPPGAPWERDVVIPEEGGRLDFSYGFESRSGPPVEYLVRFAGEGPPESIFAATVDPTTGGGRWSDASVDLSRLAGRKGRLVFETRSTPDFDLRSGFPLWGNPLLAAAADRPGPWNLLWIVLDTLRADRLSLSGYHRETSPHLDAWARRSGAVFSQAIAQAPWTLPSHVSMFTGIGPLRHGVNYNRRAPESLGLLAEHLRQHGYSTAAVTGGGFLAPAFGLSQGFDRFDFFTGQQQATPEANKDLPFALPLVSSFLGSRPAEPFFFFLHTYDVHGPFVAHQPYFDQFVGGTGHAPEAIRTEVVDPAAATGFQQRHRFVSVTGVPVPVADPGAKLRLDAQYDSGVRRADVAIGQILDQIRRLGLDQRTMIVVTSDHGEGLGEHDTAGHYTLHDHTLKVPLIIAWPDGRGRGKTISTQVRLIDLASTITESLGLPPLAVTEGQSLLPLLDNPNAPFPRLAESVAASTNQGISLRLDNRQKVIYQHSLWQPVQGGTELYDLGTDPGETDNLASAQPAAAARAVANLAQSFADQTSNLLVSAQNRSADALAFRLRGPPAHAFTAKGFAQPAGAFVWAEGEIRVQVPPGTNLEFYLDGHTSGELLARFFSAGEGESPELLARVLDLARLDQPAQFRWRGDGTWEDLGPARLSAEESGVSLRWHGARPSNPSGPPAPAPELRRQLEALGYVN